MSMIEIDKSVCTECGICFERCPACFTMNDDVVSVRDDGKRCIQCGHCIALCAADAVVHHALPAEEFGLLSENSSREGMTPPAFVGLVRRRRSHRHFDERPVSDELIQEIIEGCRYAPTGVNAQDVGVRVIRTQKRIRETAQLAVSHFTETLERLESEAHCLTAEGKAVPAELQGRINRNLRYRNMGRSFEKGWDPIFHKAPVVLIFHAPQTAPTPRDDCTIAAHTAVLYAELLGLGTCYIGLFTRAAGERPSILEKLSLPNDNQVYCTIILGYPRFTFFKVPPRRAITTTWW